MKVAVMFGGDSMERDVSVASGAQVVRALRSLGHHVLAVEAETGPLTADDEARVFARAIDKAPPDLSRGSGLPRVVAGLVDQDIDVVFLAMHGTTGEDGTLQSLLDLYGLRYTGSGRLGSALAWDKGVAKQLYTVAGIPTPAWCNAPVDAETVAASIGYPVIVKPSGQGSTVGLSKVDTGDGLAAAIAHASRFDGDILVERFIPGRELTVGILGDTALAVGEIVPVRGEIFDYEAKYQPDGAREIFPADVTPALTEQVQALGLAAHATLRLAHYSRTDFRLDPDGGLWCLETNTLPGLSPGSLLPKSAAAVGISFPELCERICRLALA